MKTIKFFLTTMFAVAYVCASAQDFNEPQYAAWGADAEARKANILTSSFLKEACNNRQYDQAAVYAKELIEKCPNAASSIYAYGAMAYKNKISRAKSLEEKDIYIDSLLLMYDLRAKYFSDHPKQGLAYILDRKAREYATYRSNDRAGVIKAFRDAIQAAGNDSDPETVVVYYNTLCEDYKNTDTVTPDEIIAEYDRLVPIMESNPANAEYKTQLDALFGLSGAASCENLEKLFRAKLETNPNSVDLLGQAFSLMSRAKCESEFYLTIAEKFHTLKPSANTAMYLAQTFQNKKDFDKAIKYLTEALATETDTANRENLLIRIALAEMATNDISSAISAARHLRDTNPNNGVAYFILAQCYSLAANACSGLAGQAVNWVAYDTMSKSISLLPANSEYLPTARTLLAQYRNRFPTSEECFFNEIKEGASYTVQCGTAAGIATTVRFR